MARKEALLRCDTKANRLALAEFSVKTWKSHSDTKGSARCYVCGDWVKTTRRVIAGEIESWSDALVGSMFEHVEAVHGK